MKKLTAGIFTILMGLVSVNAADAAVASKGYVDKQIKTQKAAYELADSQTLDDAKDYTDSKTGAVDTLATDAELKVVKGVSDLTAAVKKLDEAVAIASGDLGKLGDLATLDTVGTGQIDNNAVTADKLAADSVTTTKIANANVTADKLAANSVTTAKIADSNVTEAKLDTTLAKKINDASALSQANKQAIDEMTTGETSILKQAQTYADGKVQGLAEGAVATNTANIATLNGADTVDGSVKKQIKDATTTITAAYTAADATQTETITAAYTEADATTLSAAKIYAKTYTDQKVEGLNLAEISRVPADCGNPGNYCTLTTNGTNFVWEVIARGDAADEEAPSDAVGSSRLQVPVPDVKEPTVTQ